MAGGARLTWDTFVTGMRDSARGQPGSDDVEIEDAAHAMPIEFPEMTNRLLVDHLMEATRLFAS